MTNETSTITNQTTASSAERIAQRAAGFPHAGHLAHKAGQPVLEMLSQPKARRQSRLVSESRT
jgi:hypothetical protein